MTSRYSTHKSYVTLKNNVITIHIDVDDDNSNSNSKIIKAAEDILNSENYTISMKAMTRSGKILHFVNKNMEKLERNKWDDLINDNSTVLNSPEIISDSIFTKYKIGISENSIFLNLYYVVFGVSKITNLIKKSDRVAILSLSIKPFH